MDTMNMIMLMPRVHLLLLPRELNVRELKVEPQALEMLPELPLDLMERDVLTRLRWLRKLNMTLLLVKLRLRRSVRMRHLDIQQTPSVPNGQRKFVVSPRRMSRSIHQSPDVPRNQESSVPQPVVDSSKEPRSVMTKPRLLFRMPPRNSVLLSPRELASMSPNLFQS